MGGAGAGTVTEEGTEWLGSGGRISPQASAEVSSPARRGGTAAEGASPKSLPRSGQPRAQPPPSTPAWRSQPAPLRLAAGALPAARKLGAALHHPGASDSAWHCLRDVCTSLPCSGPAQLLSAVTPTHCRCQLSGHNRLGAGQPPQAGPDRVLPAQAGAGQPGGPAPSAGTPAQRSALQLRATLC